MAKLKRTLTLLDVYVISTGAMFSSGFFLLPGLAAAQTGASMPLAYLLAGALILPAMLCVAELSTAMPRAGGAYYFLDRSMGPLVGTLGGLGTWLALTLKSAFALMGMGAYLVLFMDLPIKPIALALVAVFGALNLIGAKETAALQRVLVLALVGILAFFLAEGALFMLGDAPRPASQAPFMTDGIGGLLATTGMVFVSYAGLTKVASVAEEIKAPNRNIPLGMGLSLLTATVIYVAGAWVMTAALDPATLHSALTPVASTSQAIATILSPEVATIVVAIAAVAAFASTGNAGVLSASRYPMAMARDRLLPERFARLSQRSGVPTLAVLVTCGLMALAIVALDIAALAKLASAFQLALFGMLSVAVIVMRESRIAYYQPGFRVPLYPWVPLLGMVIPVVLIAQMGAMAVAFTLALCVAFAVWYAVYARTRVDRGGAIYHVFERLGRRAWRGIDAELREIMAERGLRADDDLEHLVARAELLGLSEPASYDDALDLVQLALTRDAPQLDADRLATRLRDEASLGLVPTTQHAALPHACVPDLDHARLILVHAPNGITMRAPSPSDASPHHADDTALPTTTLRALLVLISPERAQPQHLRLLAHLANRVDDDGFAQEWINAQTEAQLKEVLLRDERFCHITLCNDQPSAALIQTRLKHALLPQGVLVALIQRPDGSILVPRADTTLRLGDRLTLIGEPDALDRARRRYAWPQPESAGAQTLELA